jgi:hypothetical protein
MKSSILLEIHRVEWWKDILGTINPTPALEESVNVSLYCKKNNVV